MMFVFVRLLRKGYSTMNASQRRWITLAVAIVIVIASSLTIRACVNNSEPPITIGSGESKQLGDTNWQVVSVLKTQEIGMADKGLKAKDWFMVVDLYLTNKTDDKETFDPATIALVDGKGKEYRLNEQATDKQLKVQGNSKTASMLSGTIEPNQSKRIVGVYDISKDATKMSLKVSGKAYGSNRDLVIKLGF